MTARTRRTPGGGRGLDRIATYSPQQSDRTPGEVAHDWRRLSDDDRARGLGHIHALRAQLRCLDEHYDMAVVV